ncbi:alpha/beta hydrolase family protein [Daejeonella sp.]|uniref:alpha/beta hydrolase family protein n=1 Tax=Daejeonella sp. TaxID=2805397 RepID=UPI003983D163
MKNNRRDFIKLAGMAGVGFTGASIIPAYAEQLDIQSFSAGQKSSLISPLNRFPRMVQEYFLGRFREIEQVSEKRRAGLQSKTDAEAYVREIQGKIQKCFGPWPEKTQLNARTTGTLERDAYKIEKIIFESRPGFLVTANLYIPKGLNTPLPAIIGTCGHGDPGKATPVYQSFAQGLARKGYIVLIFDPIGQGERVQYLSSELKPQRGIGVSEHNYAGSQMVLCGEALSAWLTWDAIRCVDYLLTRTEVDAKQIGVTGNSGGGTQATWLCGVERRLSMAAPSCFIVGFGQNLQNELPADMEQCPPGALSLGLDHSDFIAAMAPKPVMILDQEKDYFDVRGAEESFSRMKKLYKLYGAEDSAALFIGPEYHGYSQHNREAMYEWFNKATKNGSPKAEPALTLEKEEALWCTPNGQVGGLKSRTVYSFTKQSSESLKKKRRVLDIESLRKAVVSNLKLPSPDGIPNYRILRPSADRQYPKKFAATYAIETESSILALVYRLSDTPLLSRPPLGLKRAILYVSHHSADDELRNDAMLKELIVGEPNAAVFACDVRGIGESQPNTCNDDFLKPYGNDYFYAAHSNMLDYPYVGQKTFDVLRIIEWLKSYGHTDIHLVARGWGAVPATFAGLLSESVKQITLKNALTSYTEIAENEDYDWPLSTLLPGVLKEFDLPDCYHALASKNLRQIDPWNARAGKA